MGKIILRKTDKACALCRYWNGARGSDTIKPMVGEKFQVEITEKQTCYQRTGQTTANYRCTKFETRY